MISNDFSFVKDMAICGRIVRKLPHVFAAQSALFMLLVFLTYVTALMKNLANYASSLSITRLSMLTSTRIKNLIFSRYLSFGKLYFDRTSMGRMNQILVNFSNEVSSQIQYLHGALSQVFLLIAYLFAILVAIRCA